MDPSDRDLRTLVEAYRKALRAQELILSAFKAGGTDDDVIVAFSAVLKYLKSLTDEEALQVLGQKRASPSGVRRRDKRETLPPGSDIEGWDLEKVRKEISSPSVSRHLLERIATVRFGVTRGALSTMRTRSALLEKLASLVENEAAHISIERVIRTSSDTPQSET